MRQLTEPVLSMLRQFHINMPWKQIHQYIERVLELRLNLEIGFESVELGRALHSDFESVAEKLGEKGCSISLHGPFWDLCPGSIDPLIRQVTRIRIQQFFDLLTIFQPVQVVCHTGFDPRHHKAHRDLWLEESLAAWEPMVEQAELLSIPLLLENVWEDDPDFHKELFERLRSPFFGFCLDVGHQNSFSRTPLSLWLEALWDRLKEVHIHDNDGTDDTHLPVGKGTIDFDFLFEFLKDRGIEPLLTLEPHKEEHLTETLAGLERILARIHCPHTRAS